ncbi:hypothetical protein HDU98_010681 [Podochytrium sp. JEL0797]|nr:hypothetical protein HDU98_010681 [Podochytrium sp. JEL0797]
MTAAQSHCVQSSDDTTLSQAQRTIVIAVDTSNHANRAFHCALDSYIRPGDQIVVLNLQGRQQQPIGIFTQTDADVANQSNKDKSYALLKRYGDILAEQKLRYKVISIAGHEKQSLVDEVQKFNPSLLVVGSRGANAFSRSFLGSVSDYCAHHCTCPIMIVKPTPISTHLKTAF